MLLKVYNLIKVVTNGLSKSHVLLAGNQRLKLKVDVAVVKDSKVIDVKAAKNRELWEKQNSELKLLEGKICEDDVFFMNEYETIKYELADAIAMHKDYCLEPSMLDAPYAILKANFLLNLRTKKTTKFLQRVGGIVILPHNLDFIEKKKILAFSKNAEDIELAMQCGAMDAGDESLVKKLEQGIIHYEEFDQTVCHSDALSLISKLKPILKDKLPLRQTPRVGTDMKNLVNLYINGYEFESRRVEGINEEGHLTVPLGEISWPIEKLEANYLKFVEYIMQNSSIQMSGHALIKSTLSCPPSDVVFQVNISNYIEQFKKDKPKTHQKVADDEVEK